MLGQSIPFRSRILSFLFSRPLSFSLPPSSILSLSTRLSFLVLSILTCSLAYCQLFCGPSSLAQNYTPTQATCTHLVLLAPLSFSVPTSITSFPLVLPRSPARAVIPLFPRPLVYLFFYYSYMLRGHRCTHRLFIVHKRYLVHTSILSWLRAREPTSRSHTEWRTRRDDTLGFPTPNLAANIFASDPLPCSYSNRWYLEELNLIVMP